MHAMYHEHESEDISSPLEIAEAKGWKLITDHLLLTKELCTVHVISHHARQEWEAVGTVQTRGRGSMLYET